MRTYWLDSDRNQTSDHNELTRRLAKEVVRPAALALDGMSDPQQVIAADSPLWDAFKAAHSHRLHTALIPQGVGGLGLRGLELHAVLEDFGWGGVDIAISLMVSWLTFSSIAATRNQSLIDEWVKPFVADRKARFVGCWAISEPEQGSEHFMVGMPEFQLTRPHSGLSASLVGEHYVLNGEKSAWISNATIATHALVSFAMEPREETAGNAVALVPLDLPGVSRGKPLDKLGQRALNQGQLFFKDVRIPWRYVLTGRAQYEMKFEQVLYFVHAAMAAIFTGLANAAYEEALSYTQMRVQGGKPLCRHQLVQHRLFDLFTKVEACRALSRAAMLCRTEDRLPPIERAIAAKVFCTRTAFEVADSALQLFGARGLTRECLAGKLFRDARASMIQYGPNDVLALVGARSLLNHDGGTDREMSG
jgi:alkylation response protein AidB-like acyl-CoA dehydrogenase